MRTVRLASGPVLNCLTLGEIGCVSERAWQEQRKRLLEVLADAQASEESSVRELKAHMERRGTRLPAVMYAMTIGGARDIIETACKSQGIVATGVVDGMTADEAVLAAQELLGYERDAERDGGRGE